MESSGSWQKKQAIIKFFLLQIPIFWIIGILYILPHAARTAYANIQTAFKFYEYFISILAYCGHLATLSLLPLLILYPVIKYIKNNTIWFVILIIISSLSIVLFTLDAGLFNISHIHFKPVYFKIMIDGDVAWSKYEGLIIFCILFCIIFSEAVILHKCFNLKKITSKPSIILFSVVVIELFAIANLSMAVNTCAYWINQRIFRLPLYQNLAQMLVPKAISDKYRAYNESFFEQIKWQKKPLNYPLQPLHCTKPITPPNIILLMIDSLRYDALSPVAMPNLYKYGQQNLIFENHISGGNSTPSGMFSLHYSITPNYWPRAYENKVGPVLFDILKDNNYQFSSIWASNYKTPPFHKTIYLNFDSQNLYNTQKPNVTAGDSSVTQKTLELLQQYSLQKQPFFLHSFYYAAHEYCAADHGVHPFKPFVKQCQRFNLRSKKNKIQYRNRYLNTVYFIDHEIKKIINFIENNPKLKNSIVIITSDHGEEFDDNNQGFWGHLGNFTAVTTHIPLIIHWPNLQNKIFYNQTTSYDIVPTLLKNIFHCTNNTTDYSIGQDLFSKSRKTNPFIISGSYNAIGVLEPQQITIIHPTGNIEVSDNHAAPLSLNELHPNILRQAMTLIKKY